MGNCLCFCHYLHLNVDSAQLGSLEPWLAWVAGLKYAPERGPGWSLSSSQASIVFSCLYSLLLWGFDMNAPALFCALPMCGQRFCVLFNSLQLLQITSNQLIVGGTKRILPTLQKANEQVNPKSITTLKANKAINYQSTQSIPRPQCGQMHTVPPSLQCSRPIMLARSRLAWTKTFPGQWWY